MAFEVLDTKTVFEGRVFSVRQDRVRHPDGKVLNVDVVEHSGAVTILPIDAEGQVWFIRQYRHPAAKEILELPAGMSDEGERPETSAEREIREEIGMAAGELRQIGEFFIAPGYSSELMRVFIATNLYPDALQADEDEFLTIERYPLEEVWRMVGAGEIEDGKSLAALLLARPFLQ